MSGVPISTGQRDGPRDVPVRQAVAELVQDLVLAHDDAVEPGGDREQVVHDVDPLEPTAALGELGQPDGRPGDVVGGTVAT